MRNKSKIAMLTLLALVMCATFGFATSGIASAEGIDFAEYNVVDNRVASSSNSEDGIALSILFNYSIPTQAELSVASTNEYYYALNSYCNTKNNEMITRLGLSNYENVTANTKTPLVEFYYKDNESFNKDYAILQSSRNDSLVETIYIENYISTATQKTLPSDNTVARDGNTTYTLEDAADDTSISHATYGGTDMTLGILSDGFPVTQYYENLTYPSGNYTSSNVSTDNDAIINIVKAGVPDVDIAYNVVTTQSNFKSAISGFDSAIKVILVVCDSALADSGLYTSESAQIDIISQLYDTTFVVMAGNSGNYVNYAAMAFNVISVGASDSSDEVANLSAYNTAETSSRYSRKPTMVAPGYRLTNVLSDSDANIYSGTEYAAAFVAAAAIKYHEQADDMTTPGLIASFCNSAQRINNDVWNAKGGAGRLYYMGSALLNISGMRMTSNSTYVSNTVIYEDTVALRRNKTAYVYMMFHVWDIKYVTDVNSVNIPNYDIEIYDSDGDLVATNVDSGTNIECFSFSTGGGSLYKTFTIKIRLVSKPSGVTDLIGVCCY